MTTYSVCIEQIKLKARWPEERKNFFSPSVEHASDKSLPLNLLFRVVSGGHFVVCVCVFLLWRNRNTFICRDISIFFLFEIIRTWILSDSYFDRALDYLQGVGDLSQQMTRIWTSLGSKDLYLHANQHLKQIENGWTGHWSLFCLFNKSIWC